VFIEKEDDILEEAKMHIFKPYFQFLSTKLDLKIIESFEREETEEENKKRREEQEALEKARQEQMKKDKKKVVPPTKKPEENESNKVYEAKPSSISMADKYPKFSKWIASLFQVIKDMVITDCNVFIFLYRLINTFIKRFILKKMEFLYIILQENTGSNFIIWENTGK